MGDIVSFNRSDPEQAAFLAAVRAGEGGSNYSIGFGGKDLSGAPRDVYGFPQWGGAVTSEGPTHAAGAYQFQPGTWKAVAAKYNLNFANPGDQDSGAWYNAQQKYSSNTGGRSLDADLDAGMFEQVRSALSREWTSLRDNPSRFLDVLKGGASAEMTPGATDTTGTPSFFTSPLEAASTYFVRGGMILVGAVVLAIALWALLSKADFIPNAVSLGN